MKTRNTTLSLAAAAGATLVAATAGAANILVTTDIAVSTTWTSNNVYNLQGQIYVLPGATLTIQPGTVIASSPGGSLAVTRDARLNCVGTASAPIIFTSVADRATWTAGNPKTGTWRAVANEWGNLTIMGRGYIGKYGNGAVATNTAAPNSGNYANMEGLVAGGGSDTRTRYGGGNDNDTSGTLRFVSLRYGGKVVGQGNELNGLSLGGVGRGTVIDHIEIMNNVDDGIEIWGGTVDMKYFSIWNVGDDSLDVDQGWRGRAQFGLLVSGYSIPGAASGSGFSDSLVELDGAEKSDAQPVSTTNFWNLTCIGQPLSGKHGTKWRDNMRAQFHASIFMDIGAEVVKFDNTDGEATGGQTGYGFNGTLTWPNTWTTAYNVYSPVNPFAAPAAAYTAQVNGKLISFTDSVFFSNNNAAAYTEANARGVFAGANQNVQATLTPIKQIVRGAPVVSGTVVVQPVTGLDPRANNNAVTSLTSAPVNGFFEPVTYRGAFSPSQNWLCNWTAADAFGMLIKPVGVCAVACLADLTGDDTVGGADLGLLLGNWGNGGAGDLNNDGVVNGADLGLMLGAWGPCP